MNHTVCRYNPKKYADVDDDVSGMEANFDDILKEERKRYKMISFLFKNFEIVLDESSKAVGPMVDRDTQNLFHLGTPCSKWACILIAGTPQMVDLE